MSMKKVKRGFYSIGIAFLLSAPISRAAMQSWDDSPRTPQINVEYDLNGAQSAFNNMARIAEAERQREQAQQELAQIEELRKQELDRQAVILAGAYETLELYQVSVPDDIRAYCEAAQAEFNVCAELLEAICFRESSFIATATNGDCQGLMQVSVKWHEDRMAKLGVTDIYDKQGNIRVAADYLSELFSIYDGDLYKVLMTYNGDTSEGVSDYALEIAEISAALERIHGK